MQVKNHTNGMVHKVVESLNSADVMLFLSAVHFKGEWTHGFDPANTKWEPFYLSGSPKARNAVAQPEVIRVPMMNAEGEYFYFKTRKCVPDWDAWLSPTVFVHVCLILASDK